MSGVSVSSCCLVRQFTEKADAASPHLKMFRRLEIDVPMKKDVKTTVAILFEPQYDKPEKYDAKITPLAAWK